MSDISLIMIIIMASGAAGGFIYALAAQETHKLRLPFCYKKIKAGDTRDPKLQVGDPRPVEVETAFLGHMVIGGCAAFVVVAITIKMFGMDLTPMLEHLAQSDLDSAAHQAPVESNLLQASLAPPNVITQKVVELYIYLVGLGILGGFSGLQIISGLSRKMIKELEKKVDENIGALTAQVRKDENNLAETRIDQDLTNARQKIDEGRAKEALQDCNNVIALKPSARAYGIKARALRAIGRTDKAIDCLKKGLKLPEESREVRGVLYFNLACYRHLNKESIESVQHELDKAIELNPPLRDIVQQDKDLSQIQDAGFREKYGLVD